MREPSTESEWVESRTWVEREAGALRLIYERTSQLTNDDPAILLRDATRHLHAVLLARGHSHQDLPNPNCPTAFPPLLRILTDSLALPAHVHQTTAGTQTSHQEKETGERELAELRQTQDELKQTQGELKQTQEELGRSLKAEEKLQGDVDWERAEGERVRAAAQAAAEKAAKKLWELRGEQECVRAELERLREEERCVENGAQELVRARRRASLDGREVRQLSAALAMREEELREARNAELAAAESERAERESRKRLTAALASAQSASEALNRQWKAQVAEIAEKTGELRRMLELEKSVNAKLRARLSPASPTPRPEHAESFVDVDSGDQDDSHRRLRMSNVNITFYSNSPK